MPCTGSYYYEGQTLSQRMEEVEDSLKGLERSLSSGKAKLTIAPNGAVILSGWTPDERRGISDACAYRALASQNSWPLRQAVAKAEQASGRKVNVNAVASGLHTHDGGKTWGTH